MQANTVSARPALLRLLSGLFYSFFLSVCLSPLLIRITSQWKGIMAIVPAAEKESNASKLDKKIK
jgi:hypothetical protein